MDLQNKLGKYILAAILFFNQAIAAGHCQLKPQSDSFYSLLSKSLECPTDVDSLKKILKANDFDSQVTLHSLQGFHQPEKGRFAYVEIIQPGDIFLRYTTSVSDGVLNIDPGIQAIAWDPKKGGFNFYETKGRGEGWIYLGDSSDALSQNPLSCASCHVNGAPVMLQISSPYIDWWMRTKRLRFGSYQKSPGIKSLNRELTNASALSRSVKSGFEKLFHSAQYREKLQALSLQEQLRPLFCTTQVNLESESGVLNMKFEIPSGFWLDPMLGEVNAKISAATYENLLKKYKVKFPGSSRKDAALAWLTPVRSWADQQTVHRLTQDKVVDNDFVKAVLGVDFEHPIFSAPRCELLQYLPDEQDDHWLDDFKENLAQSDLPSAQQLLMNLQDAEHGFVILDAALVKYQSMPKSPDEAFKKLLEVRKIASQKPFLDPENRVIFPQALK